MTPRKEIIGDAELWLGDCREILPTIGAVDAVVTDPPYGVNWDTNYQFSAHNSSVRKSAEKMGRHQHYEPIKGDNKQFDPTPWLAVGNFQVIFGANCFSNQLPKGSWLIWDKRDSSGKAFMSEAECAWLSTGQSVRIISHCWQGFSRASENSQHYHPTQKPIVVMEWCIAQLPKGSATILDPFMGSGTTGVACARLGRRFIGIEIEERYHSIACRRIEQAQRQKDLFVHAPVAEPPEDARLADLFAEPEA